MTAKTLGEAYRNLISLEPVSPGASPSKKVAFLDEVAEYNGLIGMMQCHLNGVVAASGIGEALPLVWNEPEEPNEIDIEKEEPAKPSKKKKAIVRIWTGATESLLTI